MKKILLSLLLACAMFWTGCSSGPLAGFKQTAADPIGPVAEHQFTFNGYTDHWQDVYRTHYKYANLYRMNIPDLEKSIDQYKKDLAVQLGLPGFKMQEGFIAALAGGESKILDDPSEDAIKEAFRTSETVLAFIGTSSPLARALKAEGTGASAGIFRKGGKTLLAAFGSSSELASFKDLLQQTLKVISEYDLKRGWFGAETLVRSVTCTPGNPIDVMGQGMNEGNSWFVFSGLYEFLLGNDLAHWVEETGLPIVTDLGTSPIYGCDDYEGLQVQEMLSISDWVKFREKKHGYIFRDIPETGMDANEVCDGYFASVGNARQIAEWDKPFVLRTGDMLGGQTGCMVLFNPKGKSFDKAAMWDAIMDRRAVAVAERGIVLGPDRFRKAMQLLSLDREYLEEYYGDRINMEATVEGHTLRVTLTNLYEDEVNGSFRLHIPEHLSVASEIPSQVRIGAGQSRELSFEILPSAESAGHLSAIAAEFDWGKASKTVMGSLNLPPAVSTHQLLYGPSSGFVFPVSVHNITIEESIPVKITVTDPSGKEVLTQEKTCQVAKAQYGKLDFDLALPPGAYTVTTQAMGISASTQLGIGADEGNVSLKETDLNGDGINEYVMENDKVRVTLLSTGARVIEYYVKSKDDNVFFKLWPEKPIDDDRAYRERGFYPYGGFEDFLGQASVETHKVYDAEILKAGGEYAEVRMRADYNGSVIEKVFTLYGGTPLLGIRYALDMVHPEMNVLGPQPIIEIGRSHGLEDKFIIPEADGTQTYVMNTDHYYGKILYPVEGWNAAFDSREGISFVGAFPVRRPFFLHMWMNLPMNRDSHYSYTELQPWLPLYIGNTSFFSYYMWADGTSWENSLKELRDRNLITEK